MPPFKGGKGGMDVQKTEKTGEEYIYINNNPSNLDLLPANNHDSVFRDEQGLIRVVNGQRAALEQLLGGKSNLKLDDVLQEVSATLPLSLAGDDLKFALAAAVQKAAAKRRKQSAEERATRLTADWRLPKSWGEWAMEFTGMDAEWVRDKGIEFRNYWTARADKGARKLDWKATWENWIRGAKLPRAPTSGAMSFGAQDRAQVDEITQWLNTELS
jgi:hypothetical protein